MITSQIPHTPSPATLKRIFRDLEEVKKNPLTGISICMPSSANPLVLHANLLIMDGPYKDLLVHLIVHLPFDYPITGPAINIAPGLNFGHKFHEHLYDDLVNGNQICADLLTNMRSMYDGSKNLKSGWTAGYTLSAALVQLQVFFANPDLPQDLMPSADDIQALREHVKKFKMTIIADNGEEIVHSFDKPFPPLDLSKEAQAEIQEGQNLDKQEIMRRAEETLCCAISKCNIFDESKPIFGYPLDIRKDQYGRYWPTPVVELVSYEAYIMKVLSHPEKLDNYEHVRFKSSFGDLYNFWIPIFINENHWKQGYQHILNAIAVVRKGFKGIAENDFKPEMVLEVLPVILNKTIVQILQGKLHQSIAAVEAYCHFYRLTLRLVAEFPVLQAQIDKEVELMMKSEANRHKENLGDMGEFLIKLALSKYGINHLDINEYVVQELFARHVMWVIRADPSLAQRGANKNFVKSFMKNSYVGNQLFVVAIEMAKLMVNQSSLSQIDERYGLLPKTVLDQFMKKLSWIREHVSIGGEWREFVKCIGFDHMYQTEEDISALIETAFDISSRQGYNKYYQTNSTGQRRNYIPHNPNFDFARATAIPQTQVPKPTTNKMSAKISFARWTDIKTEFKGFEEEKEESLPQEEVLVQKNSQSERKQGYSKVPETKAKKADRHLPPKSAPSVSQDQDLTKKEENVVTMVTQKPSQKLVAKCSFAKWSDLKTEFKGFDNDEEAAKGKDKFAESPHSIGANPQKSTRESSANSPSDNKQIPPKQQKPIQKNSQQRQVKKQKVAKSKEDEKKTAEVVVETSKTETLEKKVYSARVLLTTWSESGGLLKKDAKTYHYW